MSDFKRLTAYRVRISDLINSDYVKVDGGADYVVVNGTNVSRARIVGTVVNKTVAEDKSYAFLTVDDGTETIGVASSRDFNSGKTNVNLFERVMIGDIVEVVGRINEWEGRRKLNSEIVKVIRDPNHWLYHKFELLQIPPEQKVDEEHVVDESKEDVEAKVLEIIRENDIGNGTALTLIAKNLSMDEEEVKEVLRKLLIDGLIYEPTKFHYRVLE